MNELVTPEERKLLATTRRGRGLLKFVDDGFDLADAAVIYDWRSGRRTLRRELEARMKIRTIDPANTARFQPMAKRSDRRTAEIIGVDTGGVKYGRRRVGSRFRPVIGYCGPKPPEGKHKDFIMTMTVMDKKRKAEWFSRTTRAKVAQAIVAWGQVLHDRQCF